MEDGQNIVSFTLDDGSTVSFSVLEQITIAGINYLLVTEEEDAYILKEIREEDGQGIYEIVEDEQELNVISKVFKETLDGVDIEM